MKRVLIVDDHPIVRKGICRILTEASGFSSVDEVGSIADMRVKLAENSYDVVILDISLPTTSGIEVLKELRRDHPNLSFLIFSIHGEEQYAVRSLKIGAAGYLSKGCSPEILVEAVKHVSNGGRYVTPRVAELLATQLGTNSEVAPHDLLSDREFQILLMIGSGKGLTEIANRFDLSVKTVSTYRSRILKKMKMKNNAEIIRYVLNSEFKDLQLD